MTDFVKNHRFRHLYSEGLDEKLKSGNSIKQLYDNSLTSKIK
jgi:hypothetical protein